MRIRNRLYPYPVLRPTTGDYLHSTFKCELTSEVTSSECKFSFNMLCTNKTVLKLIEEGKALYAVHIECKYTYYRSLKRMHDPNFSISLKGSEIDRSVEVCPVIMATEDIIGYTSSDLDDIYSGENIIIKAGNPIAIGNQATITIVKERDQLKKLSSPFCVIPYPDTPGQQTPKFATLSFSNEDQIIIYLHKEDYAIFDRIQTPENMDAIHTALFFPALIEALDYMKTAASDDDQDKKWYIALNAKSQEQGMGDIRGNSRSAFELAQTLFGCPITRWLRHYAKNPGGE